MKSIIVVGILMVSSGCGYAERLIATVTGQSTKVCIDGVTYLQFTSGATVQVDREGKPVPCTN